MRRVDLWNGCEHANSVGIHRLIGRLWDLCRFDLFKLVFKWSTIEFLRKFSRNLAVHGIGEKCMIALTLLITRSVPGCFRQPL